MKPLLRYFSCVLRVIVLLEGKPSAQSEVLSTLEKVFVQDWCLVMSFWLKVCIYSHTRGVKLGLGLGFMQTSQVLPH